MIPSSLFTTVSQLKEAFDSVFEFLDKNICSHSMNESTVKNIGGKQLFLGKLNLFCRSFTKLPVFFPLLKIQSSFRDIRGQSRIVQ